MNRISRIINSAIGSLQGMSHGAVTYICLLLIGFTGLLDHLTVHGLSWGIFYLIPILISAWFVGRRLGLIISAVSACTWLAVDVAAGQVYSNPAISIWNAGVRFGVFAVVAHLSAQLALALKRERRLARTDSLTGLMNRRAFNEEAARLLQLALSHGHRTSVIYMDVDNFKHINDHSGHGAGDRLLTTIADVLCQSVRKSDLVGRHGGDEFVVFLPETDYEGARACVATIQNRLLQGCAASGWPVTFSLGVVTFLRPPLAIEEAITVADELMYRAKKDGKGCVVHELVSIARHVALKTAGSNEAGGRRIGERCR
jgi:diguanylate cyclase (GGDEF)-like protein